MVRKKDVGFRNQASRVLFLYIFFRIQIQTPRTMAERKKAKTANEKRRTRKRKTRKKLKVLKLGRTNLMDRLKKLLTVVKIRKLRRKLSQRMIVPFIENKRKSSENLPS